MVTSKVQNGNKKNDYSMHEDGPYGRNSFTDVSRYQYRKLSNYMALNPLFNNDYVLVDNDTKSVMCHLLIFIGQHQNLNEGYV